MDHDQITVHALYPIAESDSNADREDVVLLSRGRAIVHAGCEPAGWQTPKPREPPECLPKNAYTYLPVPPLVPVVVALALKNKSIMKEWDTPLLESDKFSTADLEPFESTSFCSLLPHANGHPSGGSAVPNSSKQGQSRSRRWSGSSSLSRPPAKRMRAAELDTGPLGELIPLPHYVPAPLKSSHLASPPASAPADTRPSSFVPVPPQTAPSIEALFSSTYARVAWLIPVRGLPPWDGVSGAYVALGGQSSLASDSGDSDIDIDIVWTHASLRQIWSFLRSCSETPGSGTGPLSLSFWAAPRSEHHESRRLGGTVSSAAASADLPANRETEITPSNLSLPVPISSALKSRIADIDYVKVYCDAPRAMLVRQTLGQWAYKEDVPADVEDLRAASIRILEYAKLVLVNERGEGVLVS